MFDRLPHAAQDAAFDLRELFERPEVPERPPVKAEAKIAQPKLDLADYVSAEAEPPAGVHRSNSNLPVLRDPLGNLSWGCCGEAMAIHGTEAIEADAARPVPPWATPDSLNLYSLVGGFNINAGPPGQNPTDQGTDNQVLVDKWRDVGIRCAADGSVHKIAGSMFVDPTDPRLNRIAIWEFVVLFRAVGLPLTAQGQNSWKLTDPSLQGDAAVGSWGYHDIPYFSFDSNRLRNDSWGIPMLVDWAFDKAYAVQGLVVVTQEMLNLRGVSPAGVDWTRLNADLAKFPPVPQA